MKFKAKAIPSEPFSIRNGTARIFIERMTLNGMNLERSAAFAVIDLHGKPRIIAQLTPILPSFGDVAALLMVEGVEMPADMDREAGTALSEALAGHPGFERVA